MAAAIGGQRQKLAVGHRTGIYDYTDAGGTVLYQVLRYENPKTFRQRRPGGNGWIWKLDERRVLYRLPGSCNFQTVPCFSAKARKMPIESPGSNCVRRPWPAENGRTSAPHHSPAATC